ncbi:hypothetical protein F5Y09DRAFT_343360 [Xylaria sp. FL1042]|nr:hypothetical protein F5Y09DRAFT_343360 [Xylaria sp. FL1042]
MRREKPASYPIGDGKLIPIHLLTDKQAEHHQPGVLPKSTHSRGPHAQKATGVPNTTLPPPDDSSSDPAFQQVQSHKNSGQSRRRIRTTINARLKPREQLGLSSETRSLRPISSQNPAGLSHTTIPKRHTQRVAVTLSSDMSCGLEEMGQGVRRHSSRKTGIGGLWGRRRARYRHSIVETLVSRRNINDQISSGDTLKIGWTDAVRGSMSEYEERKGRLKEKGKPGSSQARKWVTRGPATTGYGLSI